MAGFGFETLALVAIIGMAGPLLASIPRFGIPVIIGELLAGLLVGKTGFGIVDHTDPTFTLLAEVFGTGHAAVYAVLMVSSSAALALPVIDSLGLDGPPVLSVTTQIAIADAASIMLLPLVINPGQAPRAGLGAVAVAGVAVVFYFLLRIVNRRGWRRRLHRYSRKHLLALELRVSLICLFILCALAVTTHVSIMLAGFAL